MSLRSEDIVEGWECQWTMTKLVEELEFHILAVRGQAILDRRDPVPSEEKLIAVLENAVRLAREHSCCGAVGVEIPACLDEPRRT